MKRVREAGDSLIYQLIIVCWLVVKSALYLNVGSVGRPGREF